MLVAGKARATEFSMGTDGNSVRRLAKRLKESGSGGVRCCYEAGPTGYTLQRQLEAAGISCIVVAPSLIPVKPGERIKTDRRDALKLAELLRADMLTPVRPPTEEEEAVRDLCRCREDVKEDLLRSRHRMSKFLLRRGQRWSQGKRAWTHAHRQWLVKLRFEHEADQVIFDDYLLALEQLEERVRRLDERLEAVAQGDTYRERVGWLCCLRGVKTVTAMTILSELHGFERFESPRQLMAYLGLVPSESSSGERQARGAITKTGNSHVRRILVESAWHYRHRPAVSLHLRRRRQGQPGWVLSVADKAQVRLHQRHAKLTARGKQRNKVVVAIARELVGFVWALLRHEAAKSA
jgi:transposase